MQIDYENFAAAGIQEELPRGLLDGTKGTTGTDPAVTRRRLEDLLEERRVRREIASLDMDSYELDA